MKSARYHHPNNFKRREALLHSRDGCFFLAAAAVVFTLLLGGFVTFRADPAHSSSTFQGSKQTNSTGKESAEVHGSFESVTITLDKPGSAQLVLGPFSFDQPVALTQIGLRLSESTKVHHVIVYRQEKFLHGKEGILHGREVSECCDAENVVFAWAKSARSNATKAFQTYANTAFLLESPPNKEKFLYVEAHFELGETLAAPVQEVIRLDVGYFPLPQTGSVAPLSVGVMFATQLLLQPNRPDVQVCVSCELSHDLTVTAFRNHAHTAARLLETNVYRSGILLGKLGSRSAQDAQIFIPSSRWNSAQHGDNALRFKENVELLKGDRLFLHCHYNTTGRRHYTRLGLDPKQREMCNQYLMYYPYDEKQSWASCKSTDCDDEEDTRRKYSAVPNTHQLPNLGQIAGVAHSQDGRSLFFFARRENNYLSADVIPKDTIFHVDTVSGSLVKSFGKNRFVVPHGIYLDPWNLLWVTDTTLHQVFALNATTGRVVRELGVSGVPGVKGAGFNGPTDVVVSPNKEVFISDGYGNSRVVVYDYQGRYVREWGRRGSSVGSFDIPHNLELDEAGLLYVADRENSRIQIFNQSGALVKVWDARPLPAGTRERPWLNHLSAITYSRALRIMFTIEGDDIVGRRLSDGYVLLRLKSKIKTRWPHDISVAARSQKILDVYVAELYSGNIQRYSLLG